MNKPNHSYLTHKAQEKKEEHKPLKKGVQVLKPSVSLIRFIRLAKTALPARQQLSCAPNTCELLAPKWLYVVWCVVYVSPCVFALRLLFSSWCKGKPKGKPPVVGFPFSTNSDPKWGIVGFGTAHPFSPRCHRGYGVVLRASFLIAKTLMFLTICSRLGGMTEKQTLERKRLQGRCRSSTIDHELCLNWFAEYQSWLNIYISGVGMGHVSPFTTANARAHVWTVAG